MSTREYDVVVEEEFISQKERMLSGDEMDAENDDEETTEAPTRSKYF